MSNTDISNNLDAFWMPFTANRQFKNAPRLLVSAEGMHYTSHDGRQILDGTAGLWCVNAGHCHPKITEAIRAQRASSTTPRPSRWRIPRRSSLHPPDGDDAGDLNHVFFGNSGRRRSIPTEDRARLSPRQGRRGTRAPDRAGARLSRRRLRRHRGRRHGGQSAPVWRAVRRRGPPAHTYDPKRQAYSRASRPKARNWRTRWSVWSGCMTPRPSPR